MPEIIVAEIRLSSGEVPHAQLRSFGTSMKEAVQRRGAICRVVYLAPVLRLNIMGLDCTEINRMLHPFVSSISKAQGNLAISLREENLPSVSDFPADPLGPGMILRERLTKSFLMKRAPDEGYLVSNCYDQFGNSVLAEKLGKLEDQESRAILWQKAVRVRANNVLCEVVWTEDEFNELKSFPTDESMNDGRLLRVN